MIKITEKSREFTPVEVYLMTKDAGITSVKDIDDMENIPVSGWLTFTDEKDNGEIAEILSIITPDNKVCSTQSKTFKTSFFDIASIMDSDFAIIKVSGTTKAGRPYVNCILDTESI